MAFRVDVECQVYRASGDDNGGACKWAQPQHRPGAVFPDSSTLINARRWARAHRAHTGHVVIVRTLREEVFDA